MPENRSPGLWPSVLWVLAAIVVSTHLASKEKEFQGPLLENTRKRMFTCGGGLDGSIGVQGELAGSGSSNIGLSSIASVFSVSVEAMLPNEVEFRCIEVAVRS